MREIKFRAWDKAKRTMIYPTAITFQYCPDAETPVPLQLNEKFCLGLESVLMQFTGLRDKDGKEIYEGDIIREGDGPGGTAIGTIENVNGDTVVKFLPGTIPDDWNHEYYPVFGKMDNAVVIGNVYENRGLLDKVR